MKSSEKSPEPTGSGLRPLTAEDMEEFETNALSLLNAARQGDEALEAELDRLFPSEAEGPPEKA